MTTATAISRFDKAMEFVGWQVGLLTDCMGNSITHGRILPGGREQTVGPWGGTEIAIEFDDFGTWHVPVEKLTLPGEPMRWTESFVCVRTDIGWTWDTIAFEVQKP